MVNYKDLGLVNTREMFAKAIKGRICYSGIQLQQYGTDAGYHQSCSRNKISGYFVRFLKGSSSVC